MLQFSPESALRMNAHNLISQILTACLIAGTLELATANAENHQIDNPQLAHVIQISVDGLRAAAIEELGPSMLPNFFKIRATGAYTDNARTLYENTVTMPNHVSMITGRPRDGATGHHVTRNSDPGGGGPFRLGSVGISNAVGEFVRGSGALRIDDGSGPNYVRVNESVIVGSPGSITSTVMGWYRYEDVDSDESDARNFVWESGPADFPLSFGIRSDLPDGEKHVQWFTEDPAVGGSAARLPIVHPGDWHHAAIVIDEANDNLKYYHDGDLIDDKTIRGLNLPIGNGSSQFLIGNHRAGDGARNWDGYIDDLAVINAVVDDTEIREIFTGTKTILDVGGSDLVAHWTFDADLSSSVNDPLYRGQPIVALSAGATVHSDSAAAGGTAYVHSVFDVVHDHGGRTGFYAGWNGFQFLETSWDDSSGAADTIGDDNGKGKIDVFRMVTDDDIEAQMTSFLTDMAAAPHQFSLLHLHATDSAGHRSGWRSSQFLSAVVDVDTQLGRLIDFIEADPTLADNTAVVLTSDHGGLGTSHGNAGRPSNFTVPLYIWISGEEIGAELYELNSATRTEPGDSRPDYFANQQPIRNGDVANLALDLLGLPPVPGSSINASQDLAIVPIVPEPTTLVLFAFGLAGKLGACRLRPKR